MSNPQDLYREAWLAWRRAGDPSERHRLEREMDALQPKIAQGPWDPAWQDFAASLPGFLEFWENLREAVVSPLGRSPKDVHVLTLASGDGAPREEERTIAARRILDVRIEGDRVAIEMEGDVLVTVRAPASLEQATAEQRRGWVATGSLVRWPDLDLSLGVPTPRFDPAEMIALLRANGVENPEEAVAALFEEWELPS